MLLLAAPLLADEPPQTDAPLVRIEMRGSVSQELTIDISGLDEPTRSAISQLSPAKQAELLRVYVAGVDAAPPLGGTLSVDDNRLRFTPRYPLEPGLNYRVEFHPEAAIETPGLMPLTHQIDVPETSQDPTTVVQQIYPSAERLPENQLKFYLHFSAPMSRGEAYRHVHLLGSDGHEIEDAFLELGEELWDGQQRRFTLLLDPGRVKRGLKPREELGPVLVAGRHYTLVVDSTWRDATQTPLNSGARKDFSVGPPDESPINIAAWQLMTPEAESLDPLLVRFGESLDQALLERMVWVVGPDGERREGRISLGDGEACWQFAPSRPWLPGNYRLVADTLLEDLAGNSIGRPFELDEFRAVQERIESKTVEIPFEVK